MDRSLPSLARVFCLERHRFMELLAPPRKKKAEIIQRPRKGACCPRPLGHRNVATRATARGLHVNYHHSAPWELQATSSLCFLLAPVRLRPLLGMHMRRTFAKINIANVIIVFFDLVLRLSTGGLIFSGWTIFKEHGNKEKQRLLKSRASILKQKCDPDFMYFFGF